MPDAPESTAPKRDYRDTVFLPNTPFPMRGDLPKREPALLARWEKIGMWERLRKEAAGRPKFILHDGPPYANGNLHIGHALNKILKDVINRAKQMAGYDANYVPGWDCHGLPIEWKIEEQYRAAGRDKDAVDPVTFRAECRAYAEHWLGVQSGEFQRLGVAGDWAKPYATMTFPAEAQIFREIGKFLMNGGLYRGAKPVLWSPVEKTALADAEVEYHDHKSTTIWVRFPIVKAPAPDLAGASIVIWTTTPWTMPGNRAVAYGEEIDYALVAVEGVAEGSRARAGEHMLVALHLLPEVAKEAGITQHVVRRVLKGAELAGTVCAHPLRGKGYDFDVPALPGDFVTTEAGTGFVHIAPGHGEDDWHLGQANGLPTPDTVGPDGTYLPHVPLFPGLHVYKAADPVCAALDEAGGLLARGILVHSYPHSWRSKAPLIFRNTPQWFIAMDGAHGVRAPALAAIEETRFVPPQGQNRLRSMIAQRPDWCVSRQRAWGVPIAIFVDKRTGEPLRDQAVIDRIADAFEAHGADAWWTMPASAFLGEGRNPDDYEQIRDIVEVWFESGSTHAFVLEGSNSLAWPADLYLEGSDQHRGWFRELRHAGPRALQGRAHPRLHARRAGAEDVEVARQRHRPAGGDHPVRRRHPQALGHVIGLHRGPAHRPRDPQAAGRALPPHPQHAALAARRARRLLGRGARRRGRDAGARALGSAPARGARCPRPRRDRGLYVDRRVRGTAPVLRDRPLGLLLRCAQGRALLRQARQPPPPRRVHGRRSLARPLSVGGRIGASAAVPRGAGCVAG